MELTGTIKLIQPLQEFPSGFYKRVMILTTEGQYPQDIAIEFAKEKADLLDKVYQGDRVTVGIDLRGNEFKGRYYVNVSGWRIDKQEAGQALERLEQNGGGDDMPF